MSYQIENTLITELADILAKGYIRLHFRQTRQKIKHQGTENLLDDVAPRAMVRTGEFPNMKKGRIPDDQQTNHP